MGRSKPRTNKRPPPKPAQPTKTAPTPTNLPYLAKPSSKEVDSLAALHNWSTSALGQLNQLPKLTPSQLTAIAGAAAGIGEGGFLNGNYSNANGPIDLPASLAALFEAKLTLDREKQKLMRMQKELKGFRETEGKGKEVALDDDLGECTCGRNGSVLVASLTAVISIIIPPRCIRVMKITIAIPIVTIAIVIVITSANMKRVAIANTTWRVNMSMNMTIATIIIITITYTTIYMTTNIRAGLYKRFPMFHCQVRRWIRCKQETQCKQVIRQRMTREHSICQKSGSWMTQRDWFVHYSALKPGRSGERTVQLDQSGRLDDRASSHCSWTKALGYAGEMSPCITTIPP